MIPIQGGVGGFNIDKQGIIPLVKSYLSGMGIEQLAHFSGLSKKHKGDVVALKHYLKKRRLLSKVTAAVILRLCDVLCSQNTQLASAIDMALHQIASDKSSVDNNLSVCGVTLRERRMAQKRELLRDCQLSLAANVHPEVIRIGRLVCQDARRAAGQRPGGSKNVQLLAEEGLFNMLVPWMGYNILTRAGQTKAIDDFWFCFCGVLHKTNKLRYMDNMLWYAFIKDCMPEIVKNALYESENFVMSSSEKRNHANFHLAEGNV